MNDGFYSIVEDWNDKERVLVRARRAGDLEWLRGPLTDIDGEILWTPEADYLYRMNIPKAWAAELIKEKVSRIDYPNFKGSTKEVNLHNAYLDVWQRLRREQA